MAQSSAAIVSTASTGRTMVIAFAKRYAARYLPYYAAGLLFLGLTNWLTVTIPRLQKEVFDELAGARNPQVVHDNALWIAVAAVVVIVVRWLSRILFFNPGRTIEFRLRNDMLSKLLQMSPAFYRTWSIGDLMARASDDAAFVRALVGFAVIMALNMVIAAGMALWRMWHTDAWLTVYCVIPAIAAVLILRKGVMWAMGYMKLTQVALGKVSNSVLEAYKGISVMQGAAAEHAFLRRFDAANDDYTQLNLRQAAVRTFLMPVVGVVGNLCIFLLLWQGGQHVVARQISLGDMAAYASYVAVLVGALASGGWVVGVLQRGVVSLQRCWDIAELEPDLIDGTQPLPPSERGLHLVVRDLTVFQPGSPADSPPVLNCVTFDLAPGHVLGVYGPVGAGKSTLVSALTRMLPTAGGAILLAGVPLAQLRDQDLRRAVAVVPQEPFLFSRSLHDNIGFDDPAGQVDDAKVEAAAQDAQLASEIARMPQGLATVVGERGLLLSGGQRQRAQLARALYKGGRLLILDDVLSAVDHETEERLLAVIRGHLTQRAMSAVLISHRLSALAQADEIIVLGDPTSDARGTVVERGTHAQLLALGGVYAQVWAAQQQADVAPEQAMAA